MIRETRDGARRRRSIRASARGASCARLAAAAWVLGSLLGDVSPAVAHLEVGEKSLIAQVAGATLIVHARIETVGERFRAQEGKISRPVVRVRVLETLKGGASDDRLVMAQHGHGVAEYRVGDEALLFLDPIGQDRELAALVGLEGAPTHVSRQEHDDAHRLERVTGPVLLAAVRDLVRAQAPDGSAHGVTGTNTALGRDDRRDLVRGAVIRLLEDGDTRIASGLVATLGAGSGESLLRAEDVPGLLVVVRDPTRSVGYRGALLATLESLALVDGAAEWSSFVSGMPPGQRGAALRVAGQSGAPEVLALLISHLDDADPAIAAEAAIALGRPGRTTAIPALAAALDSQNARLRFAAVRALASIGGPSARVTLGAAASSHPDEATRRRARAALRRLDGPSSRSRRVLHGALPRVQDRFGASESPLSESAERAPDTGTT